MPQRISAHRYTLVVFVCGWLGLVSSKACFADEPSAKQAPAPNPSAAKSDARQAELDAAFAKMLSGATLEGSFTSTAAGSDMTKLSKEKYTLGTVKRVSDKLWMIQTRIQYGDKDITLPITLPVEWAGDTPMVVLDKMEIPGMGVMSARVLFCDGHYAGYWKHGDHGGHLFGIIHPPSEKAASSGSDSPVLQEKNK